ncbi:MAG: hypothetical protein J1D87_11975, partial [Lachnospiraceae bacterium]|nr:hypothetical protein [Lachnospiraceae bacterium]
ELLISEQRLISYLLCVPVLPPTSSLLHPPAAHKFQFIADKKGFWKKRQNIIIRVVVFIDRHSVKNGDAV